MARGIPCVANSYREQLKHSWLENEILRVSTARIVSRWNKGTWKEYLQMDLHSRLTQLHDLAMTLIDGFSPAQLIDQVHPLKALPYETRENMKIVVHEAYLSATGIHQTQDSLSRESDELTAEFNILRMLWELSHTSENEILVCQCWEKILARCKTVHALLAQLPNGVVLP